MTGGYVLEICNAYTTHNNSNRNSISKKKKFTSITQLVRGYEEMMSTSRRWLNYYCRRLFPQSKYYRRVYVQLIIKFEKQIDRIEE